MLSRIMTISCNSGCQIRTICTGVPTGNMPLSWVTTSLVANASVRMRAVDEVGAVRSVDCDYRYTAVERLKRFGVRRQAQNVRSV